MKPTYTRLETDEIGNALLTIQAFYEKWGPQAARLAEVDYPEALAGVTRQRIESTVERFK